jgi:hypothetical protein
MIQTKMIQPRTGKREAKRYELARYWKGKLVRRNKRIDTFSINQNKVKVIPNEYPLLLIVLTTTVSGLLLPQLLPLVLLLLPILS